MDYKILNLKENSPTVEQALAIMEIEINSCKAEGVKVIKIIHGYGSHGVGGIICYNVRKKLLQLKKQKVIKDFMLGQEWDMSNAKCIEILTDLKDCFGDEDLGHSNPGITIVVL